MEERQEMEWDNSALNITVNPLDHEVTSFTILSLSQARSHGGQRLLPPDLFLSPKSNKCHF